jgi:D-hydroxyproline dehydrogenase subunit beta
VTAHSSAHAVVVGAGIVGAACALYLSRSGFTVTVLDSSFPGAGATGAGMGHLVAMDDSDAQFALTSYSLRLWRELRDELGDFAELQGCGTLWIAEDDTEMGAVVSKHRYYSSRNVTAEIIDSDELARLEPLLRRPLRGALRVPGDSVVYPPAAAHAFLEAAVRNGARLLTGWKALKLSRETVLGEQGVVHGDIIINATGNEAGKFSPECELRPRRGHLVITDRCAAPVSHQIVELGYLKSAHEFTGQSVAFNVQPRVTGQMLIGSSRELGESSAQVNSTILARMLERAEHFMPSVGSLTATRVWTGLRPTSADKLPFIGPSTTAEGVYIAAGHEGLGITTSLASGRLIAAMVSGEKAAVDVEPFLPGRASASWH